jgi:hypothetical protein
MKSAMLSAVDESRHQELCVLFSQYPFGEMNRKFANEQNINGITLSNGFIYVLPHSDPRVMLMIFLHEVAHVTLLRAGYKNWDCHDDAFVRIARELQARFAVTGHAWHDYDQQDAVFKTTAEHARKVAYAASMATDYDPTGSAIHSAMLAVQTDRRRQFQWLAVFLSFMAIAFASVTIDWSSVLAALDRRDLILFSGAGVCVWLWWNFRGGQ